MSFFADWATQPKQKKKTATKQKTPDEMIQAQVKDQLDILAGKEVKTADGKSNKKSWWNEETKVVDIRIGVMPLNNTENDIIAQTKGDYQSILEALKNWEDDKDLKKRITEIHKVVTKPKAKKKKEAE